MSNVEFKKRMCRPVDFRVKGHTRACFCNTGRDHQKPAWLLGGIFPPNMAVHEQYLSALADRTGV